MVATLAQANVGTDMPDVGNAQPVPSLGDDIAGMGASFVSAVDGAIRSTLSIVPGVDLVLTEGAEPQHTALSSSLASAFTPLAAVAFVVFVLVYTPCVATLAAIRSEHGWRWAGFSAAYQLGLAWLLAVLVFQVGSFLGHA